MTIFNIDALRPGDLLCRRSPGLFDNLVRRATGGQWSHDAIYLGRGLVGDALWSGGAVATSISEWTKTCREDGCRVIALRVRYSTPEQGEQAANFWAANICGRPYDWKAIIALGWSALWGKTEWAKFGTEASWYCTESCFDAWHAAGMKPWWPKVRNATPGTTYKRLTQKEPTLAEVTGAFTEDGKRFKILLRS